MAQAYLDWMAADAELVRKSGNTAAGHCLGLPAPLPASTSQAAGEDGAASGDAASSGGGGRRLQAHLLLLQPPHPASTSLAVAPAGEARRLNNTTCLQATGPPFPPPFPQALPAEALSRLICLLATGCVAACWPSGSSTMPRRCWHTG